MQTNLNSLNDSLIQETISQLRYDQEQDVRAQETSATNIAQAKRRRSAGAPKAPFAAPAPVPAPAITNVTAPAGIALQTPAPAQQNQTANNGNNLSDDPSLMAIINEVLILQAKESSLTWSIMYKQASMSMLQAVTFAPLIYNAVNQKYQNQANDLEVQAKSSKTQGMMQCFAAAGMVVMGAMEGFNLSNETPKKPIAQLEDETAAAKTSASTETNNIESLTKDTTQQQEEKVSTTEAIKRKLQTAWGGGKDNLKFLLETMNRVAQKSQMTGIISDLSTKLVDNHYKLQELPFIKLQGQYDAASQEMQQYAQYFTESFNRAEDFRSGSQNFIDSSMQMDKSMIDTITSTVQSEFRG